MFQMLKNSLVKQPTEEDPDEGIKDLVELTLKKMVIRTRGNKCYVLIMVSRKVACLPLQVISGRKFPIRLCATRFGWRL